MRVMVAVAHGQQCWHCGAPLRVSPAGGPSYCETCDTFTGPAPPRDHSGSYLWRRADGSLVLELYLDHSAVHAPSPA